eukprot:2410172-Pleurochrysis_carterae.AAC.1
MARACSANEGVDVRAIASADECASAPGCMRILVCARTGWRVCCAVDALRVHACACVRARARACECLCACV